MNQVGGGPQFLLCDEARVVDFRRALKFLHCLGQVARAAQHFAGVRVLGGGSEPHPHIGGKILGIIGRQRVCLLVIRVSAIVILLAFRVFSLLVSVACTLRVGRQAERGEDQQNSQPLTIHHGA